MLEYSEIEVYNPSYPVYCRAGNIDMLSPGGFLKLHKKGLLLHTVDNEVSPSAR